MACLFVLGFGLVVNAQQRVCGTMSNQQRLEQLYPELKANQAAIEEHTQNYTSLLARESMATVNIPVVVHVVYNIAAQNISDAQVISQIDVLNEDFRKMNADKVNVPSAFAGVAADCNISFCLAKKDPNGNPTTGIVRKQTSSTSFIDDDKVKSSSTGGDNAWDATKYLNLWVCNLGNGLLGYAQFPGGPVSTDGVVILYTAFGRTGNVAAPYNKGRTATHEVGHWLNLRHIWGDANCGSDLVSDTPTQQTSNYGCPTYPHITCSNSGDMSMNYMDYVDDACMYMFTAGQSSRMNALFTSGGARVGILTSAGCGTATSTSTTTPSSTSNVVIIGSGANTTGVIPYGTYYMDERAQIIVTKAELVAAGFTSTNKYIKSLAFNALTANPQVMNGMTIKIAHTTSSSFASTSFLSGSSTPVTVYSANYQAVSNSWNTHTFSTPFLYNGVDNLLIDICWNNASYNNNTPVYATTTTNYMTLYKRSDISSGGLCTTTAGTQTTYRPNMKMNFSSNSTVSSTSSVARYTDDGFTTPKDVQTNVYPNPVSGKMTLSYNVFEEGADVNMEMYDLYGRKVMASELSANVGENNTEINFESDSRLQYLQNGIYFVALTVNGEKNVKKIMLQK